VLGAAGRVFARDGYDRASLRDICAEAGANLGAIHHYFGSKAELYREVLIESHRELLRSKPAEQPAGTPEERLSSWIEFALRFTLIVRPNHPIAGPLFARELRDPSPSFRSLVEQMMAPMHASLEMIVAEIMGPSTPAETRKLCTTMVLGLCVFPKLAGEVLTILEQPAPTTESGVAALAKAITQFAIGGLEKMMGRVPHGGGSGPT
jgi:AcrR family transcriptional regulator